MDELRLIKRCLKSDKEAWGEFVDKYSRLIYNYIYTIFRAKGYAPKADDADEVYQGIFLLLVKDNFKKLRRFKAKNNCSLATWLRVITINLTLDYLRKALALRELSLDEESVQEEGGSLKSTLADDLAGVDDALLDKERMQQLTECVKLLNTPDKYFIQMHIYQRLALEELTRLFKTSLHALEVRKSRIIEKLKKCFRKKNFM